MRRFILCSTIFLSVAAGSAASLMVLKNATDELCVRIDRCEQAHSADSRSKALGELEDFWDSYYAKSSFITRSDSLEDMSVSVGRLRLLTGAELTCELGSVRERARLIYEDQVPYISGIL